MLEPRKQKSIRSAYQKAGQIETPYMRLCADIPANHDIDLEEVRRYAKQQDKNGVYRIGHYAFALLPAVEKYFSGLNVPYSFVEVDGLKFNHHVNLGLWFTKADMSLLTPDQLQEVLSGVSLVEVFSGLVSIEEFERKATAGEMVIWRSFYENLNSRMPLLKPALQESFGPSLEPNGPYRQKGYFIADPPVLEFYGGEPAPRWYREFVSRCRDSLKIRVTIAEGKPKII